MTKSQYTVVTAAIRYAPGYRRVFQLVLLVLVGATGGVRLSTLRDPRSSNFDHPIFAIDTPANRTVRQR
jgi:hypothetical protein